MSFESIEAVIDYAIEKEQEAAEFYTELSEMEPFSGAKEAFADFSKEERKHEKLLKDLKAGSLKLGEYKFEWIPDIKRSNYIVDIPYEKGMPFADILRLAMKREEKALALYNDLQTKAADNADFVKLFKMLCQEEAKHKRALETMYDDYMAEQGD